MAGFNKTIPRAVEWLKTQPQGADARAVASALGLTFQHVCGALGLACVREELRWVHAPQKLAHNRRLYFTPDHAPAVHGEASRVRQAKHVPSPQPHQKFSNGRGTKTPGGWDGKVIETKAPPFVDRRFEPDGEVPSVVDSSQARPWVVAAYG